MNPGQQPDKPALGSARPNSMRSVVVLPARETTQLTSPKPISQSGAAERGSTPSAAEER